MEGTVAHHYAAEALLGRELPVGWLHENGHVVTVEMIANASEYLVDCAAVIAQCAQEPGAAYYVEQHVAAHATVSPYNDGTPDFFAVFPAQRLVMLKDFKYGHGYVPVFRNFQLANYLIAIFESLGLGVPDDSWTIEASIYQPRNFHAEGQVRHWRPKGGELARLTQEFQAAAAEALSPEALCRTGSWCRYCTAAHGCEALQEAGGYAISVARAPAVHLPDGTSLGRELKAIKRAEELLKARREALEEQALQEVARGGRVWGWRGGYRKGRTKWTVPAERVIAWCRALGANVAKVDTLTPTQACKLGIEPDMIEAISMTPSTYVLEEVDQHTIARGFSENG